MPVRGFFMIHCRMGILGLLLGAGVSVGVLLSVMALPPGWARGVAVAALMLAFLLGSVLFRGDSLERSFGAVYLAMGVLAAVVLALPHLLRSVGHGPIWVSLGLGVAALLSLIVAGVGVDALLGVLLPPPESQTGIYIKGQISQGLSNGILLASPVMVVILAWLAWRGRTP